MKIVSWNVNGLRAVQRKENLGEFLVKSKPEVLFFQETKSTQDQVVFLEELYPDYEKYYVSATCKKGYSGVGLWISKALDLPHFELITELPGDPVHDEGRVIGFRYGLEQQYTVLGMYFPNGGKSEQAWKDKLDFYQALHQFIQQERESGSLVIFTGDVNCAHREIDLARPKNNDGVIGFHPQERACLSEWIQDGFIDVWRAKEPNTEDVYSWWHLISRSRDRNVGWRIDYFFIDQELLDKVTHIEYLTEQMGSDHCPVSLEIEI